MMSSRSYYKKLTILLLIGVVLRGLLIVVYPMSSAEEMANKPGDELGYFIRAGNMLTQHSHVDNNGKMAYFPPGYAAYLAANIAAVGENRTAIQVIQNGLFFVSVLLFAGIARRRLGDSVALWVTGILVFNPVWFIVPQEAVSENLAMPLLLGAIAVTLRAYDTPRMRWAAGAGILFGLTGLTREIGLVYGILLAGMLWLALRRRGSVARPWAAPVWMVVCMLAVIAPWSIRNYRVFHQFVPVTTNSKINLYIGNNPQAEAGMNWVLPEGMGEVWNTPSRNGANEIIVSNASGKAALEYIRAHPGKVMALWPARVAMFWAPPPMSGYSVKGVSSAPDKIFRIYRSLWWVGTLLLGLPGLWLLRKTFLGQTLIGIAVVSTLIHMLTYVRIEYRQPVDFLMAVPIAVGILHLLGRRRPSYKFDAGVRPAEPAAS